MRCCKIEGCGVKHYAKDRCRKHYQHLPDQREKQLKRNKEWFKKSNFWRSEERKKYMREYKERQKYIDWYNSPVVTEKRRIAIKNRKRESIKDRYRAMVYSYYHNRVINLPVECRKCGAKEKIQQHHNSYFPEDWLKTIPLCCKCHRHWHDNNEPKYPTENIMSAMLGRNF